MVLPLLPLLPGPFGKSFFLAQAPAVYLNAFSIFYVFTCAHTIKHFT